MNAQLASNTHSTHAGFARGVPRFLASLGIAAFVLTSISAWAQVAVAPSMVATAPFTVLGRNIIATIVTVTCTGPGTINGQVGTTFNAITNAGPPCLITGPIVAPVSGAVTGEFDTLFANIDLQNPVCTGLIPTVTTTLLPGVYCSVAGTTLTGPGVILTLSGNATDVWVFRVGTGGLGALTLTDARVVMAGGASPCNVYWKSAQGTTTTRTDFVGTVFAGAAATMTDGTWIGRMLAGTDATLTRPAPITGCTAAGAGVTGVPTLSPWAMVMLAALLAVAGYAAIRRRRS